MLAAGAGVITAEFFDTGESRELPRARRPQAAALVLTYDPDGRTLHAGGDDAPPVVIGKDATDTHSRQDRKRRIA